MFTVELGCQAKSTVDLAVGTAEEPTEQGPKLPFMCLIRAMSYCCPAEAKPWVL